ncbi:hypothetical protein GLA29479_571 [Lysobacter antibioticus]|nr:hypothetical protein GLA29479_571 [Lysobacter antibioticus]
MPATRASPQGHAANRIGLDRFALMRACRARSRPSFLTD